MTKSLVLLSLVAVASASFGQSRAELPSQPYLSLHEQSAWLLFPTYKAVRTGLRLSTSESAGVDSALQGYAQAELNVGTSDAKIEAADHAFAHSLLAALTPEHRNRLFEILLQVKGASALEDPTLATKVGLTSAQIGRIHSILDSATKREEDFDAALAQKLIALPRIAPPSLYEQKQREVVQAAAPQQDALAKQRSADEKKALSLLTASETKRWKNLLGAPFLLTRYRD